MCWAYASPLRWPYLGDEKMSILRRPLELALAWHKEEMHRLDQQWQKSGYRDGLAHGQWMRHRECAMNILTQIRLRRTP